MKHIVCFGEMLLRIGAPPGSGPLLCTPALAPHFGGAEANVAVSLACLGQRATMATVVPDHALGDACIAELRRHGVDTRWVRRSSARLGLYFLDPGGPLRPAQVIYDRANSGFVATAANAYDWPAMLAGADWLHVGGITAALGADCLAALHAALAMAAARGVRISFDCNYRPSLWRGREAEAAAVLRDLARRADLLFAGALDARLMFGVDCGERSGPEAFARAAEALLAECPRLARVASTARRVHGSDHHELSGLLADRAGVSSSRTWSIRPVIDRIGSGDAYAAGLLHALCTGDDPQAAVDFAAAAAALKHGIPGDFNPCSAVDVRRLLADGGLDVQR